MMKLRCAIIEDEDLPARLLENFVSKIPELELIAIVENGADGIALLKKESIDLIFLDIQIPEVNGIQLLERIKSKPIAIITSSFSEYALEGFRLSVVDYLLKPFQFNRFSEAVEKAKEYFLYKKSFDAQNNGVEQKEGIDFFYIKSGYNLIKIFFKDIMYIEGAKQYAQICTTTGKQMTLITLQKIEQLLPPGKFERIHKSYIINTELITDKKSSYVKLNKTKVPVGRKYRQKFLSTSHLTNTKS